MNGTGMSIGVALLQLDFLADWDITKEKAFLIGVGVAVLLVLTAWAVVWLRYRRN